MQQLTLCGEPVYDEIEKMKDICRKVCADVNIPSDAIQIQKSKAKGSLYSLYLRKQLLVKVSLDDNPQLICGGSKTDLTDESLAEALRLQIKGLKISSPFGCCSKFVQCSDSQKCIHSDLVYALACQYRKNLEQGRIFYGKNKNV